jgi:hypothetical protein
MFENAERIHVIHDTGYYADRFIEICGKRGESDKWNFSEEARPGDPAIIYLEAPVSSYVGTCYVGKPTSKPKDIGPRKYDTWFYVRDVQPLPNGDVHWSKVKEKFYPAWKITGRPMEVCFPKPHTTNEQLRAFLELLGLNAPDSSEPMSAVEAIGYEAKVMRHSRNKPLRDKVLKAANGVCEACTKDYSKVLDGKGMRVLHVHHRFQLAFQKGFVVTSEADLAVVCANCHSLLHIDPKKVMPVETLLNLLRKDTAPSPAPVRPRNGQR